MTTYYMFSDRFYFFTRDSHFESNFRINHNIYVLYKARYKNPNSNSDSFYYCELQSFYVFTGVANPDIAIILSFVSIC